jgi:hypothetical protein
LLLRRILIAGAGPLFHRNTGAVFLWICCSKVFDSAWIEKGFTVAQPENVDVCSRRVRDLFEIGDLAD